MHTALKRFFLVLPILALSILVNAQKPATILNHTINSKNT